MTILFSGGGTGGHVFPAIATIQILEVHGEDSVLITDNLFKRWNRKRTNVISVEYIPIKRKGFAVFVYSFIVSVIKSFFLIRKYKPKALVCFGGYSTAPMLIAAWLSKIPIILHESNSVLGNVNKLFLPVAKKLAFFFPSVEEEIQGRYHKKISLVGIPVTEEIRYCEYPVIKEQVNILIIGGSQGASFFSRVVPEAIIQVAEKIEKNVFVSQQCPMHDIISVQNKYREAKITAEISLFFDDIVNKISSAHIIICRAGASTIAEILAIGRPAIYVPYPYAKANHQMKNAKFIAENGAGILLKQEDLTEDVLADRLISLIKDRNELENISERANKISIVNASGRFADLIQHVVNSKNGGSGKI